MTARPEAEQPVEVCDVCPFADADKPPRALVKISDRAFVDLSISALRVGGSCFRMPPRQAAILAIFASGKILSRERILIATGSSAQSKCVDVHISYINKILRAHCPGLHISSVPGAGFRLAREED